MHCSLLSSAAPPCYAADVSESAMKVRMRSLWLRKAGS